MMRVLHVYAGNLYGGVEALLAVLARERGLVPQMEPVFALAWEGRLARELRQAGVAVDVIGPARLSRPWTVWSARRRLLSAILHSSPDVAVLHSAWAWAVFGPAVARAGVPAVFWLHDAPSGDMAERMARRAPPSVAVCTSGYVRGTLPRLFPHARGAVVYPPVSAPPSSTDARAAIRAELNTPPESVVIVQASRMEPWKGHRLHLQALGEMRDDPRWSCWLAGAAQRPHELRHRDELRALAARLGIAERVRWLGERGDIPRVLAAADLLCQPNALPEPFGITYIEAMHAGLPVVTASTGGAREIVKSDTGFLVEPGDAGALAHTLRRLVDDADLRSRLGAAGPARARDLSDPAQQLGRLHAVLAGVGG